MAAGHLLPAGLAERPQRGFFEKSTMKSPSLTDGAIRELNDLAADLLAEPPFCGSHVSRDFKCGNCRAKHAVSFMDIPNRQTKFVRCDCGSLVRAHYRPRNSRARVDKAKVVS